MTRLSAQQRAWILRTFEELSRKQQRVVMMALAVFRSYAHPQDDHAAYAARLTTRLQRQLEAERVRRRP
jgi:hypothetical protein